MPRLVAPGMVDPATAAQARMRQRQAFLGDFKQIAVADPGLEAEPRDIVAQRLALMRVPALGYVPGGVEAGVVVEQPDPKRRQSRQAAPRPAIGATLPGRELLRPSKKARNEEPATSM